MSSQGKNSPASTFSGGVNPQCKLLKRATIRLLCGSGREMALFCTGSRCLPSLTCVTRLSLHRPILRLPLDDVPVAVRFCPALFALRGACLNAVVVVVPLHLCASVSFASDGFRSVSCEGTPAPPAPPVPPCYLSSVLISMWCSIILVPSLALLRLFVSHFLFILNRGDHAHLCRSAVSPAARRRHQDGRRLLRSAAETRRLALRPHAL